MKITSSFIEPFHIAQRELNTICFSANSLQQKFKEYFINFFNYRKKKETTYVHIVDDYGEEFKGRDFDFIYYDCSSISLVDEKDTKKLLQNMLFHQLENNPALVDSYLTFRQNVEHFVHQLSLDYKNMQIAFEFSDKTIEQMIKSLRITVETTGEEVDFVPNYELRINLIESLINMSTKEDKQILFITFPETDTGVNEYDRLITYLKELRITVIILTANREFITATPINNVQLVKENGSMYDIIGLRDELLAFKYCVEKEADEIAKDLAFRDFTNDIKMLREDYKTFLLSNTF